MEMKETSQNHFILNCIVPSVRKSAQLVLHSELLLALNGVCSNKAGLAGKESLKKTSEILVFFNRSDLCSKEVMVKLKERVILLKTKKREKKKAAFSSEVLIFVNKKSACSNQVMVFPKKKATFSNEVLISVNEKSVCSNEVMIFPKKKPTFSNEVMVSPKKKETCSNEIMILPKKKATFSNEVMISVNKSARSNEVMVFPKKKAIFSNEVLVSVNKKFTSSLVLERTSSQSNEAATTKKNTHCSESLFILDTNHLSLGDLVGYGKSKAGSIMNINSSLFMLDDRKHWSMNLFLLQKQSPKMMERRIIF